MSDDSPDSAAQARLGQLRAEIEGIDRSIVELIARRVQIARAIAPAKRAANLPTLDPAREAAVIRRAGEMARAVGLQQDDVREIFWHLIGVCRRAQLAAEAAEHGTPGNPPT